MRPMLAVDVEGLDARGRRRERARGGGCPHGQRHAVDAELGLDVRLVLAVLLAVQLRQGVDGCTARSCYRGGPGRRDPSPLRRVKVNMLAALARV